MTRERKTLDVEYLRVTMNDRIARETDIEARRALCYLLGDYLMHCNRYRGFRYFDGWHGTEEYRHEYY